MHAPRTANGIRLAWLLAALVGGAVLGGVYTLSPLTLVVGALTPALIWCTVRGLPAAEGRRVMQLLVAAMAIRVLATLALFLLSPHDNQAAGVLTGDEAYVLSRTLRLRHVLLGIPALKYDYLLAYDYYGRTSYLSLLTALQMLFGPAPYGLRLVNMLLFTAGAGVMYRLVSPAYGRVPAFLGLATLLFLPTLFSWSISLLKESLYFALTASVLAGTVAAIRWTGGRRVAAGAAAIAALWLMRDLRPGAVALVGGGAACGVLAYAATRTWRRATVAALAVAVIAVGVSSLPAVRAQVSAAVNEAAHMHLGHVFTVGHAYKLLDEGYYVTVDTDWVLPPAAGARYVVRGLAAFLTVPLPWQMATRSELVFMPEQLFWYALILLAPVGVAAGLKRDALVTWVLLGHAVPTALVVALTNGNVGTLIRFRGLVTPYLVWLSALGLCVALQYLLARAATGARPRFRPALEHAR